MTEIAATFQRRPLTRAIELAAIRTVSGMRAYLAEDGSTYATHSDDNMVRAAFLGAVQFALEDLARAYEQELTRTEEDRNRHAVHEMELQAIREGSPAVQNGPYAYMTGPHADA